MDASIGNHGVWGLVLQSDFVSKMVLLVLFSMSILSWAVLLYKVILFRIKQQQCKKVLHEIKGCNNIVEVIHLAKKHASTLPGHVLLELLGHMKTLQDNVSADILQMYADQILDEVMYVEESYTPILAVTSSVATLLGLFGTVWGLIHSFIRISEKQSADIVTVAPGIAEALITTVAGLLVAIPSLIFLHYIATKTKELEHQLMNLCDKVTNLVRTSSVKTVKDVVETYDTQDQYPLS
tara:strand:- start:1353 stop:2066 length:714 start_codon:yes stop_codon:yes gene_type:complete